MPIAFRASLIALLFPLALAGSASADIPPPDVSACRSKKVGDKCKTRRGDKGVCQQSTCTKVLPGGTRTRDCVRCLPEKKDGDKKDGDKKDGDKKDGDKKKGASLTNPRTLGGIALGLGVLGLGLFFARRFSPRGAGDEDTQG